MIGSPSLSCKKLLTPDVCCPDHSFSTASTDFDFESFSAAFTDVRNIEVGATDVDVDAQAVVGNRISSVPRPTASGFGLSLGTETDSIQECTVQTDLAGIEFKRTLDVMELEPLLPEPSKSVPPYAVAATTTDALAGDLPRAKRSKGRGELTLVEGTCVSCLPSCRVQVVLSYRHRPLH